MANSTLVRELNRLNASITAGQPRYSATEAANRWAATSGRTLLAALNVKAGNNSTHMLALAAVCNQLAATSGLSAIDALSRM